jgi:hypothetical protein
MRKISMPDPSEFLWFVRELSFAFAVTIGQDSMVFDTSMAKKFKNLRRCRTGVSNLGFGFDFLKRKPFDDHFRQDLSHLRHHQISDSF